MAEGRGGREMGVGGSGRRWRDTGREREGKK